MGNSQHRYITNNEASEIIGNDTWSRLRAKLERGNLKTVDFVLFCNILQSRFERIPPLLLECLFRAFTSDFHQKLDIDTFLSSYAVLFSQDLGMKKRFLFRIYETPTGGSGVGNVGSVIEKKHLTEILYCAYADKSSHYHSIERFSESFFPKKKEFISKTKFEQWQGRLDLLTDWVAEVLGIFIEPLPPKLLSLQKKYSSPMEAEVLMKKYNMSNDLYQRLYHEFFHHCQVTYKPELSLKQWLAWVCPQYLTVDLALILFAASTDTFKTVWRFIDFAEFTLVYGCGTLEAKATAIVSAFVKAAILRRDHSVDTSLVEGDVEGRSLSALSLDPFVRDFLTYMIFLLCQTVEVDPSPQDYSSPQDVYLDEEEVEEEAATYLRGKSIDEPRSSSIVQNTSSPPSSSFERQRRRSYSLNLSAEPTVRTNATFKHNLSHQPASSMLKESGMTSSSDDPKKSPISALLDLAICSMQASSAIMKEKFRKIVPPVLIEQLDQIKESTTIDAFARLIVQHHAILPGLRDLSITTCCLFSVEPLSPLDEKEFITELTLRYLKLYPPSQQRPYGPLGTEWYLVPKSWIDAWRMFVGKNRSEYGEFNGKSSSSATSPTGSSTSNAANNIRKSQFAPGFIDNWSIIKKTGAKALLPNLVLGQDFEVVPPTVYAAFSSWYGGGPAVSRRVVLAPSTSMSEVTEIEFYPLTLVIVECDQQGKVAGQPKEMLFSKTMTIQEMVLELAQDRKLDSSKIRLWNYAKPLWKEQYILSPELTVLQANLLDGQVILLEASQSDGSWPRSLLHAYLDNEEKELQQAQVSEEENGEETRRGGSIEEGSKNKETTNTVVQLKRNNGLVGMDNLGNTCYLNSSLQALLHTDLLVEYFLSQSYLKDVNPQNKHGFGGRVANIFGKVVTDLWSTNRNCITPRYVYNEIAALRDQFAGNEQHDAHELLAFLLDGLSEDLNLVHSKPYTIQPDSDGRQDEELANIWWENHLKRDRSVIQALFTGQFKSVMTCSACAYSSARFEPFNFLTVPIPEDNFRVMLVIVVPRKLQETARVAVRVPKIGTVEDIVDRIKAMGFDGIIANDTPPESAPPLSSLVPQYFVAGELVNSRIKSFINLDRKLDTIRDNELLVIFHVTALPKKLMERYQASRLKLQSQAHQTIARSESGSVSSINKASMFGDDKSDNPSSLDSSTQKKELPVPPSFNAANISQNEQYVRVAFSQRRISYFEGAYCGVAGFDFFRLEAFGMPILEVLPNRMKCSELYQLMETRLSVYLKSSVKSYLKHLRQQLHSSTTLISLSRPTSSSMLSSATPTTEQKDPRWTEGKRILDKAGVDDFQVISSVTTEEVVAGPIPTRGFSLRLITGGSGATVCCSRCHWLNRCQGCILPDREDVEYELLDGESIAVDWHYVVFEDLLDAQMASTLVTHPSIAHEKAFLSDTKVPLERCLDKFNEQESLEGVICPRCHEDNTLKKTFMLWRLPPVLIIQLKRFQFDRTSRRKLNNRIDFPLENLDLLNYLAPTRLKRDKSTTKREVKKSEDGHDVQGDETGEIASASIEKEVLVEITPKDSSEDLCSSYDLYSVIHHIGALGGGHYVTTVRFNQKDKLSQSTGSQLDRFRMPKKLLAKGFRALTSSTTESVDAAHVNTNSDHSTNTNGSLGSPGLIEDERRESNPDFHWYTFNDNIVSEVSDLSDINSPSAYVLFYIRKDVENSADIDSLLKTQLMINSKDIRGHDPKETLNNTHGLSSPQKDPKDKHSLAGDQSAREESSALRNDQQPPSSNSRRNEYIVAKKLRIPSAKKQSKDVTPNTDTYNTAQSTTIPTNNTREASATSRQQTNSETDNNCAIS